MPIFESTSAGLRFFNGSLAASPMTDAVPGRPAWVDLTGLGRRDEASQHSGCAVPGPGSLAERVSRETRANLMRCFIPDDLPSKESQAWDAAA